VEAERDIVGELCLQHGAMDVLVAQDTATRDRLWDARRKIIDALKNESPQNHMEDVVVPRAQDPGAAEGHQTGSRRRGRAYHLLRARGDGNVHVNALKDQLSDALG
jgi:glycolate oxidase